VLEAILFSPLFLEVLFLFQIGCLWAFLAEAFTISCLKSDIYASTFIILHQYHLHPLLRLLGQFEQANLMPLCTLPQFILLFLTQQTLLNALPKFSYLLSSGKSLTNMIFTSPRHGVIAFSSPPAQ
jgi:hypothetical protein